MSEKSNACAGHWRMRSRGPPSASSTHTADSPPPCCVSHCAKSCTAGPSRSKHSSCAPPCKAGRVRAKGAACRPKQCTCSRRQPKREAASEKVEGDGKATHSLSVRCAARLPPAPNQNGSPEASTATGWPRRVSTGATSNGSGHSRPRLPTPARARCRAPPNTCRA